MLDMNSLSHEDAIILWRAGRPSHSCSSCHTPSHLPFRERNVNVQLSAEKRRERRACDLGTVGTRTIATIPE